MTPGGLTPAPAALATTGPFSVSPSAVQPPTAGYRFYARASAARTVSVSFLGGHFFFYLFISFKTCMSIEGNNKHKCMDCIDRANVALHEQTGVLAKHSM